MTETVPMHTSWLLCSQNPKDRSWSESQDLTLYGALPQHTQRKYRLSNCRPLFYADRSKPISLSSCSCPRKHQRFLAFWLLRSMNVFFSQDPVSQRCKQAIFRPWYCLIAPAILGQARKTIPTASFSKYNGDHVLELMAAWMWLFIYKEFRGVGALSRRQVLCKILASKCSLRFYRYILCNFRCEQRQGFGHWWILGKEDVCLHVV
jgi:hypothetical protein